MVKKVKVKQASDELLVKKLYSQADLPEYALATDVGFDLRAVESVSMQPFEPSIWIIHFPNFI